MLLDKMNIYMQSKIGTLSHTVYKNLLKID